MSMAATAFAETANGWATALREPMDLLRLALSQVRPVEQRRRRFLIFGAGPDEPGSLIMRRRYQRRTAVRYSTSGHSLFGGTGWLFADLLLALALAFLLATTVGSAPPKTPPKTSRRRSQRTSRAAARPSSRHR